MRAVAVDGRGLGLARLASGLGLGLARLTSGLGLVLGPGRGSGLEVDVGVVEGVGLVEVEGGDAEMCVEGGRADTEGWMVRGRPDVGLLDEGDDDDEER